MDFNMTEDQQMFVKLAKDFGETRLLPSISMMKRLLRKCLKWVWQEPISPKHTAVPVPTY